MMATAGCLVLLTSLRYSFGNGQLELLNGVCLSIPIDARVPFLFFSKKSDCNK